LEIAKRNDIEYKGIQKMQDGRCCFIYSMNGEKIKGAGRKKL
jgi:hypothetical protein